MPTVLDEIVARKRAMAAAYTDRLGGCAALQLPVERDWARSTFWMYGVVVDECTGLQARDLAVRLEERGVQTRPFFLGMHEQPVFHRMGLFIGEKYPVSERLARQGLYLPSGTALTEAQVDAVSAALLEALS